VLIGETAMTQNSDKNSAVMSKNVDHYFSMLNEEVQHSYQFAEEARRRGPDPKPYVEIPLAMTMAERVEGLVGPKGVAKEIEKLAAEGHSSIIIALKIADQIIHEKYIGSSLPEKIAEQAVRTGIAIITNGVVSAPLEGVASVTLGEDDHLVISYASPIRGAGGTAQAMSVVLAELVREGLHLPKFRPTKRHLERYVEEIILYRRIKNLQYAVSEEGIKIAVRNLTIEIGGEPTEKQEITANRDVPGVPTNRVRGGMCLVLNDGLVGRWNKTLRTVDDLGLGGWTWLRDISRAIARSEEQDSEDTDPQNLDGNEEKFVLPEYKYVSDVIGGRPILSHPSRKGGFRLRYGRGRNTGLAGVGVNPATMTILQFLATGTHIVTERPGKGSIVTPISTIEGPLVLLEDGSAIRVNTVERAKEIMAKRSIEEIIELGDILVSFGEFVENNKDLVPSGYVEEWWAQEVSSALDTLKSSLSKEEKEKIPSFKRLQQLISSPLQEYPSIEEAMAISETFDIPLHPRYTPNWHDLANDEFWKLRDLLKSQLKSNERAKSGILAFDKEVKRDLEKLAIPHQIRNDCIYLEEFWQPLFFGLLLDQNQIPKQEIKWGEPDQLGRIRFRFKAPIRVGARLGRPEKAKERLMKPPVHVLFPISNYGGPTRNLRNVHRQSLKSIEVEIQHRQCKNPSCQSISYSRICPDCGSETEKYYICTGADHHKSEEETCETCSKPGQLYSKRQINFMRAFSNSEKRVGKAPKLIKGVKLLMSKARTPEPIDKGILRAQHNVFTFKDGTCRFDMTDAPLTHFRPREIGLSVEEARKLGYLSDIKGKELASEDQLLEILPQDIIVNKKALDYLFRVSKFVDAELERIYDLEPFYCCKSWKDLIGGIVLGLAPHTSAGIVGRIIGSTPAEVCYSHPFWHAAKRRNCDGDEDSIILLMDALLNFSKSFLPATRGGLMDAPLVLSSHLEPKEVDSEAHNVDTGWFFPLAFYKNTWQRPSLPAKEVSLVFQAKDRLGTPLQYEGFGFTHDTDNIAAGPEITLYKRLKTMVDKVRAQMNLASKIRAVDADDVAKRVLDSHFFRDMSGNLRAFGTQTIRCVKCNRKYRRMPLFAQCRCGGRLILTVFPESTKKYLAIAKELDREYSLPEFAQSRIKLFELIQEQLFGGDQKQRKLDDFFGK
jgi:DNA polymerase II large subunit